MTVGQYQLGWAQLGGVLVFGLLLTAIGGKAATAALWIVGTLLAVFLLTESVSYYSTGSYKMYEVKPT
jgi:hypothetical protein